MTVYLSEPPHTVRGLADELDVGKPAISRAVDTLAALGFVKRKADETDRRNVFIQRTVRGSVYLSDLGELIARTRA